MRSDELADYLESLPKDEQERIKKSLDNKDKDDKTDKEDNNEKDTNKADVTSSNEKSNWEIMEGIIGKKKAKEVRRSLGGENTYVPKEGEEDDIKARNDKIYEKFLSGKSIKELAREYSMTTKWIRNILKSYEQSRNEENDDNINRN